MSRRAASRAPMKVGEHRMRSKVSILRRHFENALVIDDAAEKGAKKYGCLTALAAVGIIGGFVLFGYLQQERATSVGVVVPIVSVAAFVWFLIKTLQHRAHDLDDRKLETVATFLKMVEADTAERDLMRLRVDFRDYRKGGEQLSKSGGGMFSSTPTVYKYAHEWLTVDGVLADSTAYQLRVVDRIGRKEKRKRKYTKVKEQLGSQVLLQLKLKAKSYGDLGAITAALQQANAPAGLVVQRVEHRNRVLRLALATRKSTRVSGRGSHETGETNRIDGAKVLQAFLWTYDGISRARAAA